jgi:hypothetical protein
MIVRCRTHSLWTFLSILTLFLAVGAVSPASADVIATSNCLPPANSQYAGTFHQWNAPGGPYILSNPIHRAFTTCTAPPTIVGNSTTDVFSSIVQGNLSVNGVNMGLVSGNAQVMVQVTLASVNGPVSLFNTQITQLNVSNFAGNPNIFIRIDPGTPSVGQTTETNLGGGNFQISSFFDIFTDLSVDGGATWTPATGSTHMTLGPTTPEPSTVLLLGLGLAAIGFRRLRRV